MAEPSGAVKGAHTTAPAGCPQHVGAPAVLLCGPIPVATAPLPRAQLAIVAVSRVRNSMTDLPERGARPARRDDREYWAYLRPEVPREARAERVLKAQRRRTGCPARQMRGHF